MSQANDERELPPGVRREFLLELPKREEFVEAPPSALFQAKLAVADFLRSRGGNSQDIATAELIAVTAVANPNLPKGDFAWAVYDLVKEGLLKGRPPAGWSSNANPYGSENIPGEPGTGVFIHRYRLPFLEGAVVPTEALWAWRRTNDVPSSPIRGKSQGGGDDNLGEDLTPDQRDGIIAQLEAAVRKAYRSFEYAATKKGKGLRDLEDREAYEFLTGEGLPDDDPGWSDLVGYKLPAYDTWMRYLRDARKALGEQKYTPRKARTHGKSIVGQDEIEQWQSDE